jgi:hypothetical protein
MKKLLLTTIAVTSTFITTHAMACASCGCSLSSDWGTQGLSSGEGLKVDLRYDFLNQNEARTGTGKVGTWPTGQEQEVYTKNKYFTAGFEYNWSSKWGLNVQIPYIDRDHVTNGEDGTATSTSHTQSIGDVKAVMRYSFEDDGSLGIQFGMKLPTGSHTQNFSGGDAVGTQLDRGLQPGTGTTDLIIGGYRFGSFSKDWDYFTQVTAQMPVNSSDEFKPGNSINLNIGFRNMSFDSFIPQVQINARWAGKDSGSSPYASPNDSGGQTIYLSPGVTVPMSDKVQAYGFFQLPIYQNLNGYQLAPKYTISVGTRINF